MGDVKDLSNKEAIKKMKEIGEKVNTCMFCTLVDKAPFETRPMGTQKIDEDGSFWFFSAKDSEKNQEIKADQKVQLIYAGTSTVDFMTVFGTAEITKDKQKIEELWNPIAKTWFQGGKDDPNLTVVKVTPHEAYYWDTKHGKMITFLKILSSMVTGKTMDDGIEGNINP